MRETLSFADEGATMTADMRLRLHRAAHLLMNADLAVFQVARMVGYDDSLYFSRLFRKHHGVSPAAYRQRHSAGSEPSQHPKGPTGRRRAERSGAANDATRFASANPRDMVESGHG